MGNTWGWEDPADSAKFVIDLHQLITVDNSDQILDHILGNYNFEQDEIERHLALIIECPNFQEALRALGFVRNKGAAKALADNEAYKEALSSLKTKGLLP